MTTSEHAAMAAAWESAHQGVGPDILPGPTRIAERMFAAGIEYAERREACQALICKLRLAAASLGVK